MFSDWPSELVPQQGWGDEAAISAFKDAIPWEVGKKFVEGTARHLASSLGLTKPGPPTKSKIIHDKQLQVLMPALGYGLSFPLSELDILRDCVSVYCEWLSALLPNPKSSVPGPILNDPNHYARIIINHFYYLFVPRGAQGPDVINKQAVLCHRVLRTLQSIAQESPYLNEDTWQTLLMFLLHINSALLSPPTVKVPDESEGATSSTLSVNFTADLAEDAGEQLCERVLSVLFETWLLACARCFPPPPLWNALRESCQRWRHRAGLIEQWNRINFALTRKLISFMYGPSFPEILISEDDLNIIPSNMSRDCIAQVWYRILHIIGNPVDLSRHTVISKTPAFLKYAISSALVIEPSQHPCLQMLPSIFLSAMKGISGLVDAFLGVPNTSFDNLSQKGRQISPSSLSLSSEGKDDGSRLLSNGRPKCNSILHLFGPWLFEAALINCNLQASPGTQHKPDAGGGAGSGARRPVSVFGSGEVIKKTSESSAPVEPNPDRLTNLTPQHFQGGRAEALGALCRIFCSKKTGEEILPVYLARFYIALHQGLKEGEAPVLSPQEAGQPPLQRFQSSKTGMCSEAAASILVNGVDLFRLDLQGVVSLVPSVLGVLECVLPDRDISTPLQLPVTILRRAAIHILLSILPLPLHFQGLQVKEIGNTSGERLALSHLRPRLVNLLTNALQAETDPSNTQMLLGGLLFCVQDGTYCEVMDSISQHNFSTDRDHNVMSSGASDTVSSHGDYNSLLDECCEAVPEGAPVQLPASGFPATANTTNATLLTATDSEAGPSSEDPDTAHTLFVRSIYLVCHRLISSWTTDVNVSLAALELLSGLARLSIAERDPLECKRAVKWLCDYIVLQCSRPPRAHSKDLHSTIVAAFHCASVWLVAHPYLLQDKEGLATVLEVVELGISGSKSQVSSSDAPRLKHEKELKPASMRVRDAAEALLSCVLSQVGTFPSVCGAESLSSLLDEMTLLKHCNTWEGSDQVTRDSAAQHFRYFVAQNSIMLALLEQPLGNHQDPQPTVTALIRGPFGRVAWTMQLRHLPRHKSSAKLYTVNPGRPLPMNDVGIRHNVKPKYFPDSVERIPLCKADKSIPSLESVIASEEKATTEHEKLLQILDYQIEFEEKIQQQVERETSEYPDVETECVAPSLCHEFQTARLLLSHFGFLSLDALQESVESAVPSLVAIDSGMGGFARDLEILDNTNERTMDTAHVFYVKAGQTSPLDILSNVVNCSSVHPHFLEFLHGLGWTVNVNNHPGWTGHVSTAFTVTRQPQEGSIDSNHGGSGFSGRTHVLYWSDALSEMAFVVPAPIQTMSSSQTLSTGNINAAVSIVLEPCDKVGSGGTGGSGTGGGSGSERSDSLPPCDADIEAGSSISSHTSQTSYGQGSENRCRKFGRQTSAMACTDHKVYIVWLESFDDCYTFPAVELLPETVTGLESSSWKDKEAMVYIIFIHALTNGLFRIKLQGQNAKLNMAGPLVDGQVVSRRVLGILVRQTALNMCRRRRLESDSYQPPHVRRKLRIQEMVQKYRDLRFNKIRTIPPDHFKDLQNLHTLLLNNNHITALQNSSFTGLESLRYLYLYKNRIRSIQKGTFRNLSKLEQLYLHFNDLGTFETGTFSNLRSLERLFLHNNRLQTVPRGAFANLSSLRRLRLDSNALVCDCSLMWLAQMVKEKQHTMQVAATCHYPNDLHEKSITSLNGTEFQCRGSPEIREEPADIEVRFGGTAYFTCKVEGDPQPEVVWLHNNEVIGDNERYSILNDGTLMIENTQGDDVGFYECLATNQMGEVKSRKAKMAPEEHHEESLNETGPTKPRFLRVPANVNVTEGSPAEIVCEVSGIPKPDIVWTKNDNLIARGPRIQVSSHGHLSISITERQDAGYYRCTAANYLGRIAATAWLRVFVAPRLTREPDDKYVSPGSNVQLTCEADGVPQPIFTWYKDEQPIFPLGRITLSLHGITLGVQQVSPSDEGEYTCRAHNAAGTEEASAVLYVRDRVAPVIRKEPRDMQTKAGDQVIVLPCKAEGHPQPVVSWRKDGSVVNASDKYRIQSDNSLLIHDVMREDSGVYECTALNSVGYATATARISVEERETASVGDPFLQQSFEEARQQVDRALNDTISQLFKKNRTHAPNPHELLRISRFPTSEGREIARAAEKMEQTLNIVRRHVESGTVFNLTSYTYQDLLSPEKLLLLKNLSGCLAHRKTVYCDDMCFHSKYRSIDGTCNNLHSPLWGASLTGFRRVLKPVYENGFNTPIGWSKTQRYYGFFKPSARLVSTHIMSTEDMTPDHHCTHMLMQWGQFLDHDLDHAIPSISSESFHDGESCERSCDYAPPCFPIEIPPDDPRIRRHRCMEFIRSSAVCGSGLTSVFFDSVLPREQINQLTSFIDASQVYGSSAAEVRLLRNLTHNEGKLRHGIFGPTGKPMMPFSAGAPVDCMRDLSESNVDCFLAGDIRANEQSGLTAMHTLWFREHNRIASAFKQINPHWDSDTVFHEARKLVGAEMQHITYTHWLPQIIGPRGMEMLGEFSGYNAYLNPAVSNVFATAAYRFGHSLINPILHRLNATFQPIPEGHLPLHKAFFSPWRIVEEGGIDPLLRGLFATPAKLKAAGQFLNTELTEKLFRAVHEVALDLASLNIQRGRDHGLPGYSEWRQKCNLSVPENFDDLISDISSHDLRSKLHQLYGHPGNVDLWVGGLLEDSVEGGRVGPTLLCLLIEQFKRLRDGDRFWYENPGIFKTEQLQQIKQVTLGRVICDNGDDIKDVTSNVFILPREQSPTFVKCSSLPYINLRLWTDCCKDCRNAGNFFSLTQAPGFRFRRQTDFTHIEDREHFLMERNKRQVYLAADNDIQGDGFTYTNDSRNKSFITDEQSRLQNHFERKDDNVPEPNQEVKTDTLGNYEEDLTEQRIEGIETLVEQLTKTVLELNNKVIALEHLCGRNPRKRRRKGCVDEMNHRRAPGAQWKKDSCTVCRCRRGHVRCSVIECPPVTCNSPRVESGQCCPLC